MPPPTGDALLREFLSPPQSARPRVWWHWLNGNIDKDGISDDLEWMHKIGLGGLQSFDAFFSMPQVIAKPLMFSTALWKDAFLYTATLAEHLNLELAIAGSPGWSESGGPWVKPEEAMKKLVWSETHVTGGVPFSGTLNQPPTVTGPFQDVSVVTEAPIPHLYRDVAVVACKLSPVELSMMEMRPVVTTSAGTIDEGTLWDGNLDHAIHLPYGHNRRPAWIRVDFDRVQTIQSMTVGLLKDYWDIAGPHHVGAKLQASTDGVRYHTIAVAYDTANQTLAGTPPLQETVTFAPTTSRHFRLLLPTPPTPQVPKAVAKLLHLGAIPADHQITQFVLHHAPRVHHFEQKAGYFLGSGIDRIPTRHVSATDVLLRSNIVDLTSRVRAGGLLTWTPPPGRWVVLRIGYSLLGVTNHPASRAGTGLEVDKLSRTAVKAYMDSYLGMYASIVGSSILGAHGIKAMINDSWEAGPQNWTPELPAEFARRRGYALIPWFPALTGRIIGSAEETDRFLWDFRRTLGELLTESHYAQISASLHSRGMIHYGESHEWYRAFIGDGMDAKRDDDIPTGAMWMPGFFYRQSNYDADIRESASVAHIYGQNLVAAESMTTLGVPGSAYNFSPETLKPTADRELADGLNRFIIHASVHQPLDAPGPGITLGPFGQWFTRHETWAEQATPWITYLSRSSFLLQQGCFVADAIYFYGQDSNVTALFGEHLPPIPQGYAFDFASADALTKLAVHNGLLVTESGMQYRVLILDPRTRSMSLDVLKVIASLVAAGATVVGEKPNTTPSLADSDQEFGALVDAVWGHATAGRHRFGKGLVITGRSLAAAFEDLGLQPDFIYPKSLGTIWFVHRRVDNGDIYFVDNRDARSKFVDASFRVTGREPELWHADTGVAEPVSYRMPRDRTIVPLHMEPHDAVFVVFRKPTLLLDQRVPTPVRTTLGSVNGPWTVHFQQPQGASTDSTFVHLESWSTNPNPAIRYFSGTATYDATFSVPTTWLAQDRHIELNLGSVKNLAEVLVNGLSVATLWKAPFRTDITQQLRQGRNRLTLRVTNLWPNRLIGDRQPNTMPIAFTTFNPYTESSPLVRSGLLGPVTIVGVVNR